LPFEKKVLSIISKERYDQLSIREFNPKNPNIYRGIFPLIEGKLSHKEGYDMGEDFSQESEEERMSRSLNPMMGDTPRLRLSGERQEQAEKFYEVIFFSPFLYFPGFEISPDCNFPGFQFSWI
jgi:hypothetical protein